MCTCTRVCVRALVCTAPGTELGAEQVLSNKHSLRERTNKAIEFSGST